MPVLQGNDTPPTLVKGNSQHACCKVVGCADTQESCRYLAFVPLWWGAFVSLKGVGGVRALHPETGRVLHVPALGASVQSWGSLCTVALSCTVEP